MATTWLWLSLFGWFAYISTSFWLWLISAAVIAAWLTRKQQLQPSIKGNL
jgi:hypothetical protein